MIWAFTGLRGEAADMRDTAQLLLCWEGGVGSLGDVAFAVTPLYKILFSKLG